MHFAYYTSNNHRSEYVKFLNDKFIELGIGKYQKNMKDILSVLMEKGNSKLAIRYAKRIIEENKRKTPTDIVLGTKVCELVEELARYLAEEMIYGRYQSYTTERRLLFFTNRPRRKNRIF